MNKLMLIVLSREAYALRYHSVSTKDEYEPVFCNEDNWDRLMGLDVEAVVFIGQVSEHNKARFQSLIRE